MTNSEHETLRREVAFALGALFFANVAAVTLGGTLMRAFPGGIEWPAGTALAVLAGAGLVAHRTRVVYR